VEPQYPVEAGGVQGTVVLRVLVNETGIADAVEVVRASPEGFFEQAAKDAFLNARFVPGEKRGVPVKSQLLIEVSFSTYNKGAAVEPQFR
jgi:protein TonB